MTHRTASRRRYLMCPPDHFEVSYAINPWMTGTPVDANLAAAQWEYLRAVLRQHGHSVEIIDAAPGLPDMCFAANAGLAVGGQVLPARFRHPERVGEQGLYRAWFSRAGFQVLDDAHVCEGEGDLLVAGGLLLAGHGFRSDREAGTVAGHAFGLPVLSLELVDERFYHLDTCLAVLDAATIAYWPGAFSEASRALLERSFPDAIVVDEASAAAFGLNVVSDGLHVVVADGADVFCDQLVAAGFDPIAVPMSEFAKSGGAVKCLTLELHPGSPA